MTPRIPLSRIFMAAAVVFILTSCQEKIDLNLPEGEQFLVVEGWISNEPGPYVVRLTVTTPYFDSSPQPVISGALVTLRDDLDLETVLTETDPGIYLYPDSGIVGRSYQIDIELPDGGRYRSDFELLRQPVPILSISYRLSDDEPDPDNDEQPNDIYDVVITTMEPAGKGDHYRWRTILNGVMQTDPWDISVANDDLVDGNFIPDLDVSGELYSAGDTVTVIQERISKAAYELLSAIQTQTAFVGSPFDSPPAPIRGNVHNLDDPDHYALGFFGAVGRDRATVVVGE